MSLIFNEALIGAAGQGGAYEIEQSLRFNRSDSPYIERDIVSTGSRRKATYSWWFKRGNLSNTSDVMFSSKAAGAGDNATKFYFEPSHLDKFTFNIGATDDSHYVFRVSDRLFRDPSAWYHAVVAINSDLSSDQVKLWINGELEGTYSSIPQNKDLRLSESDKFHVIGEDPRDNEHFEGYMAEWISLDGTAVTDPYDFGEFDNNNVWRPIEPSGLTFGTNGFYLKFDPTATNGLSEDYSGNDNHFSAPINITTSGTGTDVMSDTPTNNFCTINPLAFFYVYYGPNAPQNGNLEFVPRQAYSGNHTQGVGTFPMESGKWYFEVENDGGHSQASCGIFRVSDNTSYPWNANSSTYHYVYSASNGNKTNTSSSSYGASWSSAGDIVGVAYDGDNGTLTFYKNGTSQGTAFTGLSGTFVARLQMEDNSGAKLICNFGQRDFAYTPPTGFNALSTSNIPAPTIKDGSKNFATTLWAGDNTSNRTITTGLQSDFIWIKRRDSTVGHLLFDAIRGAGKTLRTQSAGAESDDGSYYVQQFNSNNFLLGNTDSASNATGGTYVSWTWKANGTGSSNTSGTITSTVSANASAGFSIVSYSGNNNSSATVGHGLGVSPDLVIIKDRSTSNYVWMVKFASLGGDILELPGTRSKSATSSYSTGTVGTLTSTTFGFATGGSLQAVNNTGQNYIAYCFAEVEGYSKIGSYRGNGNTDGTVVYCGFKPAFILIKGSDHSSNWRIMDDQREGYNPDNDYLRANATDTEASSNFDILSNGFKLRNTDSEANSSNNFVFAAFASHPFGGDGITPATAR